MTKIKQILLRILIVLPLMSFAGAFTYVAPVSAACDPNARFLTLPAWYRGLAEPNTCDIKSPSQFDSNPNNADGLRIFIQILAINIVEILLHITAYVAVAFVIVGGFQYITSAGSPDANEKGRKTITNALIGLGISIASIAIVNVLLKGMI